MEDTLYETLNEPVELTESELDEVTGGWCDCCCGPKISLELELSLCL